MVSTASIFDPTALTRSVPRYTSYPTAPHFSDKVAPETYARWLSELPGDAALSLYLHIPFCDELCWFCACRTQGTQRYKPVARYLDQLEAEIALVASHLDGGQFVTQMHWGGGSPTILSPDDTLRLRNTVNRYFPGAAEGEFAVEVDPRDMNAERLEALSKAGLTRASIGVQDFDERVQQAIGRHQGYEMTRDVIAGLRGGGASGVNVDILYGLPGQTTLSLGRTLERVIGLQPDRIAMFGYAHVPWMAKRQKLIDETQLPGPDARRRQSVLAASMLTEAGYQAIGIDHFALPGDSLSQARAAGTLRRNFQGYTVDPADALIGMGASAIGSLPHGYVQNDPVTATYQLRAGAGRLPTVRGHALTLDDQVRRDAIEQILCQFSLDAEELAVHYGDFALPVQARASDLLAAAPVGALAPWRGGFRIEQKWRHHARLIAAEFDGYLAARPARHSLAL